MSEAQPATLWSALVNAQSEFETVEKDRVNPHFKNRYATLSSLIESTRPALTRHGLAVVQLVETHDGTLFLNTRVVHRSGQHIESSVPLLCLRDGAQKFGSELTYMRRYSYAAILNVVADEDDDGEEAQKASTEHASALKFPARPARFVQAPVSPPPAELSLAPSPTDKARTWADVLLAEISTCTDENMLHDILARPRLQAGRDRLKEILPEADEEIAKAITARGNQLMAERIPA